MLIGDTVAHIGNNIDCIYQDSRNIYWFGSNGEGVFCYDGRTIVQITSAHGLCCNYVWKIMEDVNGMLWFETRDGACTLDGVSFVNYTYTIAHAPVGQLHYTRGGLFFNHLQGLCYYDGISFTNIHIHNDSLAYPTNSMYRPYAVYCTYTDSKGKVWCGTQEKGVAMYDGEEWTYIYGHDLQGPAVRSIFEDKNGVLWFGNNGGGLFSFADNKLRNVTAALNLGNEQFLKNKKLVDKPGSMARVFAINGDTLGNIWIGTVDAGVWKYDGTHFTNYTVEQGLQGHSVSVIYKDRNGVLWFVVDGKAIMHFNGKRFVPLKV